jgi:hypothetical protein
MLFLRRIWDASAVHEDNFPGGSLFLQESRFQPLLVYGARTIGDAPFVDVGDPSRISADVNILFGYVPFVSLALGMLRLDEVHECFSAESGASFEYAKVWSNHRVELRDILGADCIEDCANRFYDLTLFGSGAFVPGFLGRTACRKGECESNSDQRNSESRQHEKTSFGCLN